MLPQASLRLLAYIALTGPLAAQQFQITFDEASQDLTHGSVLAPNAYSAQGVTIEASRTHDGTRNRAVIFDTNSSHTLDPDLEAPFAGGNLAGRTDLGNALIISDNLKGAEDGIVDNPSDTASGGHIYLTFASDNIAELGFSLYDSPEDHSELAFSLTLTDSFGLIRSLDFSEIRALNPGLALGDHFANSFQPISAADFGLANIKNATFHFDGSGALDTITYCQIPEPHPALLGPLGLSALLIRRKRR